QIKGAKPSVEQKPGKFQPLNPFRGIDSASTTAPTPAEVAKDILTLNIRGVRGITPMPDNGTVKYPGPGPALYTPVVWVELDTLRDTLFGLLTPELLDDDSVPVWRDP